MVIPRLNVPGFIVLKLYTYIVHVRVYFYLSTKLYYASVLHFGRRVNVSCVHPGTFLSGILGYGFVLYVVSLSWLLFLILI